MINFCILCGQTTQQHIPDGDNRPRAVCTHCGHIHYRNPLLVVGCIAGYAGALLLCKRAIEPGYGQWTLPAGFMENNESTEDAAIRETLEEACADVVIDAPFCLFSLPEISQVHLFFRGHLKAGTCAAGPESLETRLFHEADIPWPELAFESVRQALHHYLSDRRNGRFVFRSHTLSIAHT